MRRSLPLVLVVAAMAAAVPMGFLASRQAALLTSARAVPPILVQHPEFRAAERKVHELSDALAQAERQLSDTLAAQRTDASRKQALTATVTSMERDVATLRRSLNDATTSRDTLQAQLQATADALSARTVALVDVARQAAGWRDSTTDIAWKELVADAKVTLCDKGSRRRHARCHEAVEEALHAEVRDAVQACVRAGQATPALVAMGEAGPTVPAVVLPDDRRFTQQGYAVELCDPALPEAVASL